MTPLSVFVSWEEELLKEEYAYEDINILRGSAEQKYATVLNSKATWTIVNFESLLEDNPNYNPNLKRGKNSRKRIGGKILRLPWDSITIDESTKIRKPGAEITRHICNDVDHITYRALLTGLPDPESVLDYFQQFYFLYGSFMSCFDYWMFRRKYFKQAGFEWVCHTSQRRKIREEVHKWAFVLTRKRAGIGSKKIYSKRTVEMNSAQKKMYKGVEKDFEYEYKGEVEETKWVPVKYVWMQRISGGFTPDGKKPISDNKLNEIINLLKGDLKNEPTIIWFRYDAEVQYISKKLRSKGFNVGIFTGADKTGDYLFKSSRIQILCAQEACGQYGLDWSRSSTSIYYSNYYDGEIRAQSEDRIIHPKKKDPVLYIDLLSEGSLDRHAVEILRTKKLNAQLFSRELISRCEKQTG